MSAIRLSRVRLFIHHDSYAYLEHRRPLTAALVRVAGPSATHIVLCEDMKQRLLELYGRSLQVVVVPNSTNTELPFRQPRVRAKLTTIGFISNLSRSKGVVEFLDIAERVCSARPDVRALLAGPISEASLVPVIKQRVLTASWIKYTGPVYGQDKSNFYSDIDVFLFPTRHADEADPRVINEALAHGVAVIASRRGCIASVLEGGGGTVIENGVNFVRDAEELILKWSEDPVVFASMSAGALANSARSSASHHSGLRAIIDEMVGTPKPPSEPA
ncbi:MAG TPA: hypothetical protein DEV93_06060 [Chloroflexi bacterium]|jgi:glycosyltransferase involved in cell wall biosynthesis|nr:hypothetical protein [Chloroflexota bacterium]